MRDVRVLVSGAGSCVGQGIVKSLRSCSYPVTIISADISPFNAALYRADEAIIIPKVDYCLHSEQSNYFHSSLGELGRYCCSHPGKSIDYRRSTA